MKQTLVKGLLAGGMLLVVSGCETSRVAYRDLQLMEQPFTLRSSNPDLDLRLCRSAAPYLADCEARRASYNSMRDNVRENVYDSLYDRLFTQDGGGKTHWRMKKNRLEWQYRF
ncbi:hypothetical protein VSS37_17060 [Candidatus Thiothrix sp. Deng01]|uniref:Lipoprotein n=1 Tax=Candidatus Thiothrix phosphatis TaxID=3112415 RepID=A0ABU6D0W9_9GAMM|nr:hypothetical protein [Candidatus Thiothrix sp. Deng01]MEB4592696.1 hypothetical protein [Candidatus Thiothrix sp. Deng01]